MVTLDISEVEPEEELNDLLVNMQDYMKKIVGMIIAEATKAGLAKWQRIDIPMDKKWNCKYVQKPLKKTTFETCNGEILLKLKSNWVDIKRM